MARGKQKNEQVVDEQVAQPEQTDQVDPVDGNQFQDQQPSPPVENEVSSESPSGDEVPENIDAPVDASSEDEFHAVLAEALGDGPDPNNYRNADNAQAVGFVLNPVAGGANPYQADTSREFVNGVDHEPASETEDDEE